MKKLRRIIIPVLSVLTFSIANYLPADTFKAEALEIDEGFQYEIVDNEIVIEGFENSMDPVKEIPEEINGLPVTTIKSLFGNIEEIVIPSSVKKIESKAFKSNYDLKTVIIPASVTEFGTYVFDGCEKLEYCNFGANIKEIPDGTFTDCLSLKKVDYPNNIESFGTGAFLGCSSLESINIPDQMKELPVSMLSGCSSLTSVDLPDELLEIGAGAFKDCSLLTEINIPESVEYIGRYAFSGCSSVKELIIPEKVEIINDGLFNDCTSLSNVVLPEYALNYNDNTLDRYGQSIFRNCSSLKKIYLPYGLDNIGESCFDGCTALESVSIPNTVKKIDSYAFRNCASLTHIYIPDYSVVDGHETFSGCSSLKELYVPETVYSFGYNCIDTFKNCSSLETIYIPVASHLDSSAFKGCDKLNEVYINADNFIFRGQGLGYIYDENTDTYVKNENLKFFCREGSTVQKYAEENGFDYEIISGYPAKISYVSTYSKDTENPKPLSIIDNEIAFINGDGEYRLSERAIFGNRFNDIMDIVISTGIPKEDFPDMKIIPNDVNFDGVNIFEYYGDVSYEFAALDDGMYYLLIHAEDIKVNSDEIQLVKLNVSFEVYSDGNVEYIMGDVNLDGMFNVYDVVLLQKWLAKDSDINLANWFAGDFTEDGKLNVIDLCLMKRALALIG